MMTATTATARSPSTSGRYAACLLVVTLVMVCLASTSLPARAISLTVGAGASVISVVCGIADSVLLSWLGRAASSASVL
eukprot:6209416-Prymnesium_polylepis.1